MTEQPVLDRPDFKEASYPLPERVEGQGYYLRRMTLEDVNDTYLGWMQDPQVIEFLQVRFERRDREALEQFVAGFDHINSFLFAICDAESDTYVGNISLRANPHHLFANMGYLIGDKAYWERGAAQEAVRMTLDFAFFSRKIRKVIECTTSNHISSNFNFKRLGFTLEANIPDLYWSQGKFCGATYWSMSSGTWADIRQQDKSELNL